MGLALRHKSPAPRRASYLRPLTGATPSQQQTSALRKRGEDSSRSRDLFLVACLFMTVVAVFGIGRVTLTAKAAEASVAAAELRVDIQAEESLSDALEVDRSSLATPARIESIAGGSLKMAQASQVRYLALPTGTRVAAPGGSIEGTLTPSANDDAAAVQNDAPPIAADNVRDGAFGAILASVMELAAGEAHVLLLGDVGLATTR